MRRSFRSTTALAAILVMLAPAALLAETQLAPEKAAAMDEAARSDMPQRASQLDEELAQGLSAGMLTCLGDAPRPCPDDEVLVTPGGLAVRLAQDDAIILAPRKAQREMGQNGKKDEKDKKGKGAAKGDAAAVVPQAKGNDAAAAAKAGASGEKPAKKDKPAARAEKKKERAAPRADGKKPKGDGEASSKKAPEAPDAAALAASLEAAGEASAEQKPRAKKANAAAADKGVALEATDVPVVSEPIPPAEPQARPAERKATPIAEGEPKPGKNDGKNRNAAKEAAKPAAEPVVSQPKPANEDQPDAGALAAALAAASGNEKPVVNDAPAVNDANAAAAAKAAGATGKAEAPEPVVVDAATTRSLDDTLKAAEKARQAKAAKPRNGQPKQQPKVANQAQATGKGNAAEDAAASAAAAGTPLVADALNAPATISDDATALLVTKDSARSSSDDFATRITDGLTRQQKAELDRLRRQVAAQKGSGKPVVVDEDSSASNDDDDSGRDIARLLLAGVGGYVLANVLANNGQVALATPDRLVVQQPDGSQRIIKDDNALLLQPGAQVTNENFADGSSRSIVTRTDGSRVVTIRDANLQVLRRTLIASDGTVTELIDDAAQVEPVVISQLPPAARPVQLSGNATEEALRDALAQEVAVNRSFTLGQIRNIPEVRSLVAPIDIDAITFNTGSAAISPDQAQQLATLGKVISDYVRTNPREMFLIEGHTDTVGSAAMNLALSDRRAESVALALSQYFRVPPENLVVQGYGERFLKVGAEGDVRENRRASVRRITDLLATE